MELTKRYETLKITCVSKKVLGFGWFSAPSWKWGESGHKKWFLQAANRPNARVLVHWKRFDRYLGSPRHILRLVSVELRSRFEQGYHVLLLKLYRKSGIFARCLTVYPYTTRILEVWEPQNQSAPLSHYTAHVLTERKNSGILTCPTLILFQSIRIIFYCTSKL